MLKNKKYFKQPPKHTKEEKHLLPVKEDREGGRDEMNEFMALYETKKKPKPKLTKHEKVFD